MISNPSRQSLEKATALLGYAIADRLFSEKDPEGRISPDDREWFGDWAHDRLAELFENDRRWNRRLRGPRGRDYGYMWVGHWMEAFMKSPEADRKRRIEMRGLEQFYGREGTRRRNPGKRRTLRDQYGDPVPNDLVLLPDPVLITEEDFEKVMDARWYEVGGILMAPYSEMPESCEDNPLDAGIDLSKPGIEIDYVDDVLHRGNEEDGFYHA